MQDAKDFIDGKLEVCVLALYEVGSVYGRILRTFWSSSHRLLAPILWPSTARKLQHRPVKAVQCSAELAGQSAERAISTG